MFEKSKNNKNKYKKKVLPAFKKKTTLPASPRHQFNTTTAELVNEFKIGRSSVDEILLKSDRWLNVENSTVNPCNDA